MTTMTNEVKEVLTRVAGIAFKMGADGVDKYMASVKMDAIIDELMKGVEVKSAAPKAELTTADMMDKIAQNPDRFIRGITILDRYPRVEDRDAFTIIKTEPVDKYTENVHGVIFETYSDGTPKCIYVTGNKNPSGTFVCSKKYFQVEIPTWVRS